MIYIISESNKPQGVSSAKIQNSGYPNRDLGGAQKDSRHRSKILCKTTFLDDQKLFFKKQCKLIENDFLKRT